MLYNTISNKGTTKELSMDIFPIGFMAAILALTVVLTSHEVGKISSEASIKEDCDNFSSMSIDGNVYQCKLIQNNPK